MLNGLDLFSGIGGLTIALSEWVRPVAYCDVDRYAQAVILSRQSTGELPRAPICTDILSMRGGELPSIDIIYGGFPCQDISVAGLGVGLEGKRSGLFFEIMRLVGEIRPSFIYLENVPAITIRGLREVTSSITQAGYDCRWITLSAAEVGANHRRERWWLLAHTNSPNLRKQSGGGQWTHRKNSPLSSLNGEEQFMGYSKHDGSSSSSESGSIGSSICYNSKRENQTSESPRADTSRVLANATCKRTGRLSTRSRDQGERASDLNWCCEELANTPSIGLEESLGKCGRPLEGTRTERIAFDSDDCWSYRWWSTEPNVGRVANGVPFRVDRIKGLGNAVVPLCAKEAFKKLMGIK